MLIVVPVEFLIFSIVFIFIILVVIIVKIKIFIEEKKHKWNDK